MSDDLRTAYHAIKDRRYWQRWPVVRHLRALQFRRLQPFHQGRSTGLSVIRYYWADFLEKYRADIRGHGLEVGETATLRSFGGEELEQADAIDVTAHSPEVRVVADLSRADAIPADRYDCFVNQFTTNVIYDIDAALYHAVRLLKPGGVLLINFWSVDFDFHSGLDMGTGEPLYMHHWFTPIQVQTILRRLALTDTDFTLELYGNLLTRMAFLMNLPAHNFTLQELNTVDPGQPLLICARIVKPSHWSVTCPTYQTPPWLPTDPPDHLHPQTGHYGRAYLTDADL